MSVSSFPTGAMVAGLFTVNLDGDNVTVSTPIAAIAGFRFNSDGTVDENQNGVYTQIDAATDWILPNDHSKTGFEVRATLNSGDTPTGGESMGVWLALTSNREFSHSVAAVASESSNLTIEIRKGGVVRASGTYTMSAQAT